jgi:NADPH:quinone reductase-like Zn-dependent oxidoreductase
VRANEYARKPATISHVEAASLPLAGITAWESLVTAGNLQAGQRVLVHAGSGGVGSLAIQIAKDRGATVIATTSGRNRALVESLGADEVIDYTTTRFTDALARARERGSGSAFVFIGPNVPVLDQPAAMVESGRLRPIVGAEFALRDIAKAHALSESGRTVGKIVLYAGAP